MREAVEVQLQEAREALAHQETDTEAARSEARVLTRQLEVRLGWPPGISTCPFSHHRAHVRTRCVVRADIAGVPSAQAPLPAATPLAAAAAAAAAFVTSCQRSQWLSAPTVPDSARTGLDRFCRAVGGPG